MTRKPRKRGYTSYSYTKKSKICVLTAIDRNKASFTKPVGFGGLKKMMLYFYKDIQLKTAYL